MWYVYELSYEGSVFYVGMSHRPIFRYNSHIYDNMSRCYDFIRFCIVYYGKYPEISIISGHNYNNAARDAERAQIAKRLSEGCVLLNFINTKIDRLQLPKNTINIPAEILDNCEQQIRETENVNII